MPAAYLDKTNAADGYTDPLTLGPDFRVTKALIVVQNNDAFMQFAQGDVGNWHWADEREWRATPQSLLVSNIIGVRFRNAAPGQVAVVTASLLEPDGPDFESGFPTSTVATMIAGIVNADGSVAAGSGFTCVFTGGTRVTYRVTFTTPFARAPVVVVTPLNDFGGDWFISVAPNAAGFTVIFYDNAGIPWNFLATLPSQ